MTRDHFVPVASGQRWRKVAVNPDVTTAIDRDGVLWQWGREMGPHRCCGVPRDGATSPRGTTRRCSDALR